MLLRTGTDLIEVSRVQNAIEKHGERFLNRVYTEREIEEADHLMTSLAARWAAKEAVAKAFCTGIGEVRWKEIEILRGPNREPNLHLHGNARTLAEKEGLTMWSISLSHTETHALAMVVAVGNW
ncbi:MAG: holo-ACP synthase [Anaerolineales bacterium]